MKVKYLLILGIVALFLAGSIIFLFLTRSMGEPKVPLPSEEEIEKVYGKDIHYSIIWILFHEGVREEEARSILSSYDLNITGIYEWNRTSETEPMTLDVLTRAAISVPRNMEVEWIEQLKENPKISVAEKESEIGIPAFRSEEGDYAV